MYVCQNGIPLNLSEYDVILFYMVSRNTQSRQQTLLKLD